METIMCTAVNLKLNHHFFGRNLDLDRDYGVAGVTMPEGCRLSLRHAESVTASYSVIGAGLVSNGFPLYFDAMNRSGLCAAGLNFPSCAVYRKPTPDCLSLTSFELIPYILTQCKDLVEALTALKEINITDDAFSDTLPATPLHWIFADKSGAVIVEPLANGLNISEAVTGVLTNSPEFAIHVNNMKSYPALSPVTPLAQSSQESSLGRESSSLPGGLSSEARFVRASFFTGCARKGSDTEERGELFSILAATAVPCGSVLTSDGRLHFTRYTSCCDTENGAYIFKTPTSLIPSILYFENKLESCNEIGLTNF